MIEGRMNGVAEAHHGQSMFGFGFPMNASYANFVKEAQHYGRQLPHEIKVTNPGYHGPYVGADHQTPINLVQKDLPPETNGYAAFSHRNVGAPSFPNLFPYSAPSLIPGPYTPHQQVHFTPHRSHYTTPTAAPIALPISRPGPESSPIEVKTSSASVNGENHAFKKPDEGNSRYYHSFKSKPRKQRQVHVSTPAPLPGPITTIAPSAPQVIEQSPQPQVQPQSQQLQPPQPTLNENAELSEIDIFGAGRLVYFGHEKTKKSVTRDEYFGLLQRGELIPIEQLTMDDWQRVAKDSDNDLLSITVKRISENQSSGKVRYSLLHGNQMDWGVLEVEFERPLFVFGRGWTSYLPDRTRERCKGMHCSKINEGDRVLILTPKKRKKSAEDEPPPVDQPPKKRRIQKHTDLNENRTSDSYHEFANNTCNNNTVSIAAAAATAAASRTASKRPFNENDSNNNNESSAKRKRSAEEAKARRWSDSCLEKTC